MKFGFEIESAYICTTTNINNTSTMKKFNIIDFGTIEHPSNFKIKVRGTSDDYKSIKRDLIKHEGSNNFEHWFSLNLEINDNLRKDFISIEESISLAYLLKKVENSNQELKELIRTWRENELKLPKIHKFYINNILYLYYKNVIDNCPPEDSEDCEFIYRDLDRFIKFAEDYKPRLLKSSDFFTKRHINYSEYKLQNLLKIIQNAKLGYYPLITFYGIANSFHYIYE